MPIVSLRLSDFRNFATAELQPSPDLNIIYGQNGSGKTNLLESIYCLALGRSFKTTTAARLIRHSTKQFSLFAQLLSENEHIVPIGFERNLDGSSRLRMSEQDLSHITELAYRLPVRIINSQSHHLFESGPNFRRKYLDWGLFYYSEQFLPSWRQFMRTLKQRNAVLRDRRSKNELDVWTEELVKQGLILDQLRVAYVNALKPQILELTEELLSISHLDIAYYSGWQANISYADVLADQYINDSRLGHTQFGPHRADLEIKINRAHAKHFLSRGQQKLLICAMILAQGKLLAQYANKRLLYLVDDLPSELDLRSKQKLISLLAKQNTQVFITAIESKTICDFIGQQTNKPAKVFHVEQGTVVVDTSLSEG